MKLSKKFKIFILKSTIICMLPVASAGYMKHKYTKDIEELEEKNVKIVEEYEDKIKDLKVYEGLYEDTTQELVVARNNYEESNAKLSYLEERIRLSKEEDKKYNETNFASKDLTKFPIYTVEEMNEWIAERAPEGSSFIGKGEEFLRASQESNLDPRYLIAHAALESGWGTSDISKDKNNFYGIGAYNHDPYKCAKTFNTTSSGIIAGALWISENYTTQGQNTLNKMIYGKKSYCVEDDGTPAQSWIDKIVRIVY